jgi:hypothetical protein
MSILPSVRATLAERFLFNFRLSPEALSRYLPAPWLVPHLIRGYGVVSFCLLDLRNITVAPLPTLVGLNSISCAPRYAVLDNSEAACKPAVFVTERHTNSAFGAWFTTLGFSAPHPHVEVVIKHQDMRTVLQVTNQEGGLVFAATVHETPRLDSELFPSALAFSDFIAEGVTSYGLSRYGDRLTVMDLHKEDATYEPLAVSSICGPLVEQWQTDGGILDSAFRTSGGRYEWTYHGLTD